jgi:hypothetical protein
MAPIEMMSLPEFEPVLYNRTVENIEINRRQK